MPKSSNPTQPAGMYAKSRQHRQQPYHLPASGSAAHGGHPKSVPHGAQIVQNVQPSPDAYVIPGNVATSYSSTASASVPAMPIGQTATNSANITDQDPAATLIPTSFLPIIADIMRGFGDCDHPLVATVQLVERILLQQLRSILADATDLAVQRRRSEPNRQDFVHLMRGNPLKVQQMQEHLRKLHQSTRMKLLQNEGTGRRESTAAALAELAAASAATEPDASAAVVDEAETEEDRYDEEKMRRMFRADRITQQLTSAQYERYIEARRVSFSCHNSPRMQLALRRWLQAEFVLSNEVFSILAHLAYETVGVLCDYALLTRLDSGNRRSEPDGRYMPRKTSHQLMHLCPEVTQGRAHDGLKPITTQEVHEATRRLTLSNTKTLGSHRVCEHRRVMPYLAF